MSMRVCGVGGEGVGKGVREEVVPPWAEGGGAEEILTEGDGGERVIE